jgi:hypothetical protein
VPGLGWALLAAAPDGPGVGAPRRLPPRPAELIAGEGNGEGVGVGVGTSGKGRREARGLKLGFPPFGPLLET